jgi:TonB family protein
MAAPARRLIAPFLLAAFAHSAFGQVPGRDLVGPARDLYASARYDEALAVLNDLRPTEATSAVSDRKSIEQYRSLCLLALGRGSEAQSAIEAVITADPSYQPAEADASPRVRSAFSDVRRRLLPDITTSLYGEAKAVFNRKDYPVAAQQFKNVVALLDDPDMGGKLSDLRTLAAGFLELAATASAPAPEAPKPAAAVPPSAPVVLPDPNRIYTLNDRHVTAPVVIRQDIPHLAPALRSQAKDRGAVEIVIDEQGRVTAIAIRQSVHPMYDAELLSKGRDWRYQPATIDGKPVKFRKMIQLNINRD